MLTTEGFRKKKNNKESIIERFLREINNLKMNTFLLSVKYTT